MEIKKTGVAGTVESSDIIVRIEPKEDEGVELTLESAVMQQYGNKKVLKCYKKKGYYLYSNHVLPFDPVVLPIMTQHRKQ